jgi:membrane protease YdiL (CAAX protease family)
VGRVAGLSWASLGLSVSQLLPGLAYGAVAAGAIALVYVIGMALPLTRRAFLDTRYQIPMRAAVLMSLVTIPLATVVFEEVAFRSVLWGLLEADHGTAMATAVTSVLFGLWHVLPALDVTGTSTAISDGGRPPRRRVLLTILGTVLFTALAGVVFAELRRRSDSLVAPVLLHWATNGLAVVAASRMWKVSPPLQTPPPG